MNTENNNLDQQNHNQNNSSSSSSSTLDYLKNGSLGKPTAYDAPYQTNLLQAIPRQAQRQLLHPKFQQYMQGFDLWNAYEVSWLNHKNKPQVAILQILIPADSLAMPESKSFKLYLNAFQQMNLEIDVLKKIITDDLNAVLNTRVLLTIICPQDFAEHRFTKQLNDYANNLTEKPKAICLDALDINCDLNNNPDLAKNQLCHQKNETFTISFEDNINALENYNSDTDTDTKYQTNNYGTEILYSHLLKSNCLITNQPDWASIKISYTGRLINHESLLKYIISFRQHQEFHEHCVERIFCDLMEILKPDYLTVFAQYTRRGGLDINPFRSNQTQTIPEFIRHARQ